EIDGFTFDLESQDLGLQKTYQPSPYFDFNGAHLLYYASYPTITDSMERLIVQESGFDIGESDWSLVTSTQARDIFYYRNINLNDSVLVTIRQIEKMDEHYLLHTTLSSCSDQLPIADVFTVKKRM